MRRTNLLFAAVAAGVFFLATAAAASADTHPPHWTDGTTFQGGTNYGPPPLPARWDGAACGSDLLIDPPTFTYVTVHAFENGTEYASEVVPYDVTPPALLHASSALLDGHKGYVDLSWNIGTGISAPLTFDCTTPVSTSTTTRPTSTTTVAPTGSTATSTSIEMGPPASIAMPAAQLPFTGGDTVPLTALGIAFCTAGAFLARRH